MLFFFELPVPYLFLLVFLFQKFSYSLSNSYTHGGYLIKRIKMSRRRFSASSATYSLRIKPCGKIYLTALHLIVQLNSIFKTDNFTYRPIPLSDSDLLFLSMTSPEIVIL